MSVSTYISHNKPQNINILIWKQTFIHIYNNNKNKISAHERRLIEEFHSVCKEVVLKNHNRWILTLRCKYSLTEWDTWGPCNEWGAALHHIFEGNTICLKWSALKMSYSCGAWIWHEYTHFTHSYIHNIHKPEPIQAGLCLKNSFRLLDLKLTHVLMGKQTQNRNSYTGSVLKIKVFSQWRRGRKNTFGFVCQRCVHSC